MSEMKILDVFTKRPKWYKKLACQIGWHSDISAYEDKLLEEFKKLCPDLLTEQERDKNV